MHWINSKFYGNLMTITNHIILSLLWFIGCLPVVTIFSSTFSLFKVVRMWKDEGDNRIFIPFIKEFKNHFFQKILLNIVFGLFYSVIYMDLNITLSHHSTVSFMFMAVTILSILIVTGLGIQVFTFYEYMQDKNTFVVLKNCLMMSLAEIHLTVLSLLFVFVSIIVVYLLPLLMFIVGSFIAHVLIKINDRTLKKIEIIK